MLVALFFLFIIAMFLRGLLRLRLGYFFNRFSKNVDIKKGYVI